MLAVLLGSGIGDIAVVVTRYYGGTKLGTGGLVRAYSGGVKAVLEALPVCEKIALTTVLAAGPYRWVTPVERLLPDFEAPVAEQEFAADVTWRSRSTGTAGGAGRRAGRAEPRRDRGCAIMRTGAPTCDCGQSNKRPTSRAEDRLPCTHHFHPWPVVPVRTGAPRRLHLRVLLRTSASRRLPAASPPRPRPWPTCPHRAHCRDSKLGADKVGIAHGRAQSQPDDCAGAQADARHGWPCIGRRTFRPGG